MQPVKDSSGPAVRALEAHLDLVARDIARWLELFADDAVVEMPYAPSIERTGRFVGKPAIDAYFRGTPGTFRDLVFRDLRVYAGADPDLALAEVHGSARIGAEGRPYEQDYVMIVRTRGGQIVEYREYWNPVPVLAAFAGQTAGPAPEVSP